MDVIIYIVSGILVGALCAYLLLRLYMFKTAEEKNVNTEPKQNLTSDEVPVNSEKNNLEEELQNALQEADRMNILTEALREELNQTKHKLSEKEKEILAFTNVDTETSKEQTSHESEAAIKQLKNKIEELEEELEDTEDEKDSLSLKIKCQKEELEELQSIKEEHQKLKTQLETAQEDLEVQIQSNAQKEMAIKLVSDILTANQLVSEERSINMLNAIDQLAVFLKEKYFPLIKDKNRDIKKEEDALKRWVSNKKKTWIDGKTAIAFVGEFSAGKTSIVNRILSQDKPDAIKLPVSSKATTAIPTYISNNDTKQNQYRFVAQDESQKQISEQTFKLVKKEILDEVSGISTLIKYFVMSYDNPNLNNLSILDTPGFTSNDREDANRTLEVINECDALFWVFDVNNGTINKTSLTVIKKNLRKPLYIIINKVDSKAPSEVKEVEEHIVETFKKEKINYQGIIHFSQKTDVNTIMDIIKSVQPDQSTEGYLERIQNILYNLNKENEEKLKNEMEMFTNSSFEKDEDKRKIYLSIEKLKNKCNEIAEIPKLKEKWFSADRYEMSKEEGDKLFNLIKKIAGNNNNNKRSSIIKTIYLQISSYEDNIKKTLKSQSKKESLLESFSETKRCIEDYNKLRSNIISPNKTALLEEYCFNNKSDIKECNNKLVKYVP